jgi:hypothetical protein
MLANNQKRNKRNSRRGSNSTTPFSTVVYRGPILNSADSSESDTVELVLSYTNTLSSTAGGVISSYFVSNITSSPDWANVSVAWAEYRILGVRLEFQPNNRYSKTSTVCTPIILAIDRQAATVPTSYAQVMQYASAVKRSLEDPWVMECRMEGIEDSGFTSCSTVSLPFGFPAYADGLSISTQYGRYFFYWRTQFRGRI